MILIIVLLTIVYACGGLAVVWLIHDEQRAFDKYNRIPPVRLAWYGLIWWWVIAKGLFEDRNSADK